MTCRSVRLVTCGLIVLTASILAGACSSAKKADTHVEDLAAIERFHSQKEAS